MSTRTRLCALCGTHGGTMVVTLCNRSPPSSRTRAVARNTPAAGRAKSCGLRWARRTSARCSGVWSVPTPCRGGRRVLGNRHLEVIVSSHPSKNLLRVKTSSSSKQNLSIPYRKSSSPAQRPASKSPRPALRIARRSRRRSHAAPSDRYALSAPPFRGESSAPA